MALESGSGGFSVPKGRLPKEDLRDYDNWVGQSAAKIRKDVISAGGWAAVFDGDIPGVVSRVRNYFNYTPQKLTRLDGGEAALETAKIQMQTSKVDRSSLSLFDRVAMDKALRSCVVYRDGAGRAWFLMHHGSTPYHVGDGKAPWHKKAKTIYYGQSHTVFKLISPDGTGGSLELIIKNPRKKGGRWELLGTAGPYGARRANGGESQLGGKAGDAFPVDAQLNEITRGSYNYAETVLSGPPEHTRMDVKPHKAKSGFYINPEAATRLADRIFPLLVD